MPSSIPFLIKAIPPKGDPVYQLKRWPVLPRKGETITILNAQTFEVTDVIHDFGSPDTFATIEIPINVTQEFYEFLEQNGWKISDGMNELEKVWPKG